MRLQHISDDTIISVGNIAYHFKNKEAIVEAILKEWEDKQREVLIEYRHTPIFANIDRIFVSLEELQNNYSFFFTDTVELKRSYPALFLRVKQFFQWQVLLFEEIIRFNISRGALESGTDNDKIHFISYFLVQNIHMWKSLLISLQEENTYTWKSLSSFVWQILLPYMTESGKEELRILKEQKIRLNND